MKKKEIFHYFSVFSEKFNADNTTTWAASLAYYTALSLAPILILFVVVSGHIGPNLQVKFVEEARALVGADAAATIETIIKNAHEKSDVKTASGLFGLATLAVSASLIFVELRSSLNHIFRFKQKEPTGLNFFQTLWHWIKARVLHMGLALSFIFSLIVSLIVSSFISSMVYTEQAASMRALNIVLSFLFYMVLFALVFRYLPEKKMAFRFALRGGLITSGLFIIGKELIGLYLGNSALGSAYGAAGSVIVLLVWVYYSALITFVGAQFTSISLLSLRSSWKNQDALGKSSQSPAA